MQSFIRYASSCLLLALALATLAFAAKEFVAPEVHPARTYPANEEHKDERVVVAIDPFDTSSKTDIFTVHYGEHNFLPVRLIITNEGDEPIELSELKVRLITANRTKIPVATTDDLYRRLSSPQRNDQPSASPIPLPRRKAVKGALSRNAKDEIENTQFAARAVEPHSTQAGFLFFDIQGISDPLPGAHIDVTGMRNSRGGPLMFFDVPLDKYLNSTPAKP